MDIYNFTFVDTFNDTTSSPTSAPTIAPTLSPTAEITEPGLVVEIFGSVGINDNALESEQGYSEGTLNLTIPSNATLPNDSVVLQATFGIYGSALVVILLVFCWARLRFPKAFNIRAEPQQQQQQQEYTKTTATASTSDDPSELYHRITSAAPIDLSSPLANRQYGLFEWTWKIFKISDDEILDHCGLDALCCIHLCSMGWKMSVLGMINSVWLMPIYSTADHQKLTEVDDVVHQLTTGNIKESSSLLIATAVATYIVFGHAMWLILREFDWFIKMRHRFLQKTKARNYAVFLRNIPKGYRSNRGMRRFFERSIRGVDVIASCICMKVEHLKGTVSERDTIIELLEHAVAVADERGERPIHTASGGLLPNVCFPTSEVDSIDYYAESLKSMNQDIVKRIHILNQKASQQPDDASDLDSDADSSSEPDRDFAHKSSNFLEVIQDNTTGAFQRGVTEQSRITGEAAGFIAHTASNAVKLVLPGDDGELLSSGFVVFRTLSSCQAALRMIHHETPYVMEVNDAGDPEDIVWKHVGREHHDLQIGLLLSVSLSALLCLFWTVPVAFVASLTNLDALRRDLPSLDKMLEEMPFLESLFEFLAPQLLVLLNALLPVLLSFCSKLEGHTSGAALQASLFIKLAWFVIIQTFFVSTFSGAVLQEMQQFIASPKTLIDHLAESLPAQSTFFTQLIFVTTSTMWLTEGLGLIRISVGLLRMKFGPKLTPREREKVRLGFLRPMGNPRAFNFAKRMSSILILLFMVYMVYSVIAPLISFVSALCFCLMESLFRHQFIYVYRPTPDSAGKVYLEFIKVLTICLLIAEITIVGLMALKKSAVSTFLIPLVIVTLLFAIYLRRQHLAVAQSLPSKLCLHTDRKKAEMDVTFLRDAYLQPEMQGEAFPNLSPEWLDSLGFDCKNDGVDHAAEIGMSRSIQPPFTPTGIKCRVKRLEVPTSGVFLSSEESNESDGKMHA